MAPIAQRGHRLAELTVLDAAVSGVGLCPVFQPITVLGEGTVVGFEALTRWPGLGDPDPERVFAHAAATDRLGALDQRCIAAALDAALRRELPRGALLTLNCEPLGDYLDRADNRQLARAHEHLRVIFELTERSLLKHPRALLRKVAGLRADGFGIALDDVGAHPDSLALLDVICPDIVKLDVHLVQSHPSDDQARILSAVLAHVERTGAVLLAEGIESDAHLEQALSLGATLGQGYKFGRPGPLVGAVSARWTMPPMKHPVQPGSDSPFDVIAGRVPVRTARKATLIPFSRQIEAQARLATDPPMVMASVQLADHFTRPTSVRYSKLAQTSALVAVFGRGLPTDLGSGVRGVDLDPRDPLCGQWIVLILGPHHCAALVAREQDSSESVPDSERRFDFAITYDRVLVTVIARSLLDRIR
ncbi:EAL domain-containing protein [Mycobacterium sp. MBM]|nr:EAL domain-containing protein [Mycobacterium sp. MBM]